MKKVYRHIGYYEGQDALDMFCFDADSLVACMTAGPFHSSDGESETDIENLDDEEDKCLFSKSSDQEHLVRYSRGGNTPKADGWFIDVYRLTEVESDDQDTSNPDELIEEYCEHCCEYVDLPEEFKVHTCPNCGKYIVACNLCPYLPEEAKCATCPLSKQAHNLNELKARGVASTVQIFTQAFNNADIEIREQGFEVTLEVSGVGMVVYTLAYNSKQDHCVLFRKHAGGNSYTFPGSAIVNIHYLCDALNSLSGERTTGNTPIHVKQVK